MSSRSHPPTAPLPLSWAMGPSLHGAVGVVAAIVFPCNNSCRMCRRFNPLGEALQPRYTAELLSHGAMNLEEPCPNAGV